MAVASGTRFQEFDVVTGIAAGSLASTIQAKVDLYPPTLAVGSENVAGTRWALQHVVHDGSAYTAVFMRWNIKP